MPLQVGDKVRVVKFDDEGDEWPYMIGSRGEVLGFDEDNMFNHPIEVKIDGLYALTFSPDELEVVTE